MEGESRVPSLRRDERAGAAMAKATEGDGRLIFCRADIKEQTEIETAIKTAVGAFGGIDILCANAGIFPQAKL
jgi:3-oxoacyl-[acyl-carrier protein] reductase